MTSWTLRRADVEDAASLETCIDAAYSIYATKGIELPAVSDGLVEDIQHNIVWVAVIKRQVVGCLVLIAREDHAVLANVAVDPAATGLGLGRALLEQAEREVRTFGLGKLTLTTHADIPENVRLYEYLGWTETERRGSKVFMEKVL
ncbi:MAG: GNAT family N-acetyltransferase [Alphaproteobacteria bacterium]|nr:GNAT family N-acetyltransferase [Alphaproteobacteria bacterium]